MNKELIVRNSIAIDAPMAAVWNALVNPEQTKKYMFGCETVSDWKVGSPLLWKMMHEGKELIAVKGKIVDIRPGEFLAYTTIDPNSGIEDRPENYLTVTYELLPLGGKTQLTVTQGNYALVGDGQKRYDEAMQAGGWSSILEMIKQLLEEGAVENK
jgi:uncharacterized protein YndB with AHSA1/START domain